ncbi:hypothetical protein LTR53_014403 [Teratosphaeriaceae sp. CCFEE 6253]|nr:hypothetical protein LTR53_014403 [Teratosphaeriaceae sp. CCFEE 6253]
MGQYTAEVSDDGLVRPEIRSYFETFYATSDTPDGHEKYAASFTTDAKLIMASNAVQGRAEILNMRRGMWEKVAKRSHKPEKIFAFGPGSDEVMLFGTVDYELKDGKKTTLDWSARAHLAREEGELKMSFYQVYLAQDTPHITAHTNSHQHTAATMLAQELESKGPQLWLLAFFLVTAHSCFAPELETAAARFACYVAKTLTAVSSPLWTSLILATTFAVQSLSVPRLRGELRAANDTIKEYKSAHVFFGHELVRMREELAAARADAQQLRINEDARREESRQDHKKQLTVLEDSVLRERSDYVDEIHKNMVLRRELGQLKAKHQTLEQQLDTTAKSLETRTAELTLAREQRDSALDKNLRIEKRQRAVMLEEIEVTAIREYKARLATQATSDKFDALYEQLESVSAARDLSAQQALQHRTTAISLEEELAELKAQAVQKETIDFTFSTINGIDIKPSDDVEPNVEDLRAQLAAQAEELKDQDESISKKNNRIREQGVEIKDLKEALAEWKAKPAKEPAGDFTIVISNGVDTEPSVDDGTWAELAAQAEEIRDQDLTISKKHERIKKQGEEIKALKEDLVGWKAKAAKKTLPEFTIVISDGVEVEPSLDASVEWKAKAAKQTPAAFTIAIGDGVETKPSLDAASKTETPTPWLKPSTFAWPPAKAQAEPANTTSSIPSLVTRIHAEAAALAASAGPAGSGSAETPAAVDSEAAGPDEQGGESNGDEDADGEDDWESEAAEDDGDGDEEDSGDDEEGDDAGDDANVAVGQGDGRAGAQPGGPDDSVDPMVPAPAEVMARRIIAPLRRRGPAIAKQQSGSSGEHPSAGPGLGQPTKAPQTAPAPVSDFTFASTPLDLTLPGPVIAAPTFDPMSVSMDGPDVLPPATFAPDPMSVGLGMADDLPATNAVFNPMMSGTGCGDELQAMNPNIDPRLLETHDFDPSLWGQGGPAYDQMPAPSYGGYVQVSGPSYGSYAQQPVAAFQPAVPAGNGFGAIDPALLMTGPAPYDPQQAWMAQGYVQPMQPQQAVPDYEIAADLLDTGVDDIMRDIRDEETARARLASAGPQPVQPQESGLMEFLNNQLAYGSSAGQQRLTPLSPPPGYVQYGQDPSSPDHDVAPVSLDTSADDNLHAMLTAHNQRVDAERAAAQQSQQQEVDFAAWVNDGPADAPSSGLQELTQAERDFLDQSQGAYDWGA